MSQKSLTAEALKGTVFLGSWGTLSQVIGIVNSFIVLYLLTIYEYGLYVLVLAIIGFASSILFESMDQLVATDIMIERGKGELSKAKKIFQEYFITKIILGFIAFAVLFFGAEMIASQYGYNSISLFIKLGAFLVLFRGLDNFLRINFKVNKKFFQMGSFTFLKELIKIVILLTIVFYFDPGIAKIIFTMVVANFLTIIFIFFYNRKDLMCWFSGFKIDLKNLELWKIIKAHGKWNIFAGVVSKIQKNIKPWLIKFFISTEAVAIYNFGKNLYTHLDGLIPIKKVVNQLLPEIIKDRSRLKRAFIYGSKYSTIILVLTYLAGLILMPIFVYIAFPKYWASIPIFMILSVVPLSFGGVNRFANSILFSLRQQKILAYFPVLKIFLVIILNSLLLPIFGIYGMAFEFIISNFLVGLIIYFSTIKKLGLKWHAFTGMFKFTQFDLEIIKNILTKSKNKLSNISNKL